MANRISMEESRLNMFSILEQFKKNITISHDIEIRYFTKQEKAQDKSEKH